MSICYRELITVNCYYLSFARSSYQCCKSNIPPVGLHVKIFTLARARATNCRILNANPRRLFRGLRGQRTGGGLWQRATTGKFCAVLPTGTGCAQFSALPRHGGNFAHIYRRARGESNFGHMSPILGIPASTRNKARHDAIAQICALAC